jgi:hypothetical protein
LEARITNLSREIDYIRWKENKKEKRDLECDNEILAETLLLDASINDPKVTFSSIADSLNKLNTKVLSL